LNFNELNIHENLVRAIQKKGFVKVSEIQEKVIPTALLGKDIVGKSQTGTGKTAAFAIPLIEKIKPRSGISALIIVPTRELAMQVKDEIASLAFSCGIKSIAVFGGQNISTQARLIEQEPEIIVGTPGRLLDLLERGILDFGNLKFLVLDEADKMFDMGFKEDIELLISQVPSARQTMLFSATMPQEILRLAQKHLKHDKEIIDISTDNAPVEQVEQFYAMLSRDEKVDFLFRLLQMDRRAKTLVFCRTKRTVDWLERMLARKGLRVQAIHGGMRQNARNKAIDAYKRSMTNVLIATDIVARGIHVDNIDNVVNFDFPEETETYIHRIGRTARQGKKGMAITFCSNLLDLDALKRVAQRNNSEIRQWNQNLA